MNDSGNSGARRSKHIRAFAAATFATAIVTPALTAATAPPRDRIVIQDTSVYPESITSARDGRVWIAGYGSGVIYLAKPGAATAEPWIAAEAGVVDHALGLVADERRGLLWACTYRNAAAGTDSPRESAIRTFDLATGKPRATYAFEGGGGCNDMAIARDGTVYASDFPKARVLRLTKGDTLFREWAASPDLAGADGIALLADTHVYINTYRTGLLFHVPVLADGKAGKVEQIMIARSLVSPDGMRAAGPHTLLVAEGAGRLTALTINGATATLRTVSDVPDSPASLTLIGKTAFVLQAKWQAKDDPKARLDNFQAIAVPYPGK